MSRHPSPGPSHNIPHMPNQGPAVSSRQKSKPITFGIAAGAEDVKYQAKYKDLKRKVKEIEADNDKLHFKVLQAKRSIQRMKLERAILYERLAVVPPSPEPHDRHVHPILHAGPGVPPHAYPRSHSGGQHHREMRDHHPSMEHDHNIPEYVRSHGHSRIMGRPDGRPGPVMDTPMGPGVAPSSHSLSAVHSSRRTSSDSGHDMRHLPPIPHLPPVLQLDRTSSQHASPPIHHPNASSSHGRTRSQSSSRRSHQAQNQSYHPEHTHQQQYVENLPPVQHVFHSPPPVERQRSRRHDIHELAGSHGEPHGHGRAHSLSHHSPRAHPSEARSSSRIHPHQRLGPGTYINRDDPHERVRERHPDYEREREWERGHDRSRELHSRDVSSSQMLSPPTVHRSRQPMERADYHEHHISSRAREDPYYHETGYARVDRSGTPGSGSGSGSGIGGGDEPSRPDSRTHYYEHEQRTRSYRLRPVNQPNEEIDFVHEDGRSQSRDRASGGGNFPPPEQARTSSDSRKRTRNDMEVDGENDIGDGPAGAGSVYSGRMQEDRGSKRYHREHLHRGLDNQDDDRMGPS